MKFSKSGNGSSRVMRLHEALDFPCPYCGAKPQEMCYTANDTQTYEHTARIVLRNLVEADQPPDRKDNSRTARLARTLRAARRRPAT